MSVRFFHGFVTYLRTNARAVRYRPLLEKWYEGSPERLGGCSGVFSLRSYACISVKALRLSRLRCAFPRLRLLLREA